MAGIKIKSDDELKLMRPAGVVAAKVLDDITAFIKPGVTTRQVDNFAAERIKSYGGVSAFLGYRVAGRKYPCYTCLSVNEGVVHGLASERVLNFGDIVSVDVGVVYNGFIGDTARTVAVGGCSVAAQRLLDVTEQSLYLGIAQARAGNRVIDISIAVQKHVEDNGFSVVRDFVGHGVGRTMHEEPQVPNFDDGGGKKNSPKLKAGMTIAIEPMVNAGRPSIKILNDGWTVVTEDGSLSAHFEHTVLITDGEPEILTWAKTPFVSPLA
ncbi:MAG TPA: type I methionyl aminopeptidase [Verrucomicrobiae bacterium]